MFEVLWGKKFNQSSIQNAQITSAVGEEGRLTFRNAVAVLAVLFCLHSHNSFAVTDDTIPFNIPQQRADTALTQFAEQANLTLVFPFEQLKDKTANRLVGDYPIATAINLLLRNTGLTPRFSDQLVLTIVSEPKGKRMNITNSSKRKTVLAGLVGLFAAGGMTQGVAQGGEAATGQSAIDEIIVTANKREQRLIDIPMSITAMSGEDIGDDGIKTITDLSYVVPNLSVSAREPGFQTITIRGVGNQLGSSPLVGVYLDEVPVSVIPQAQLNLQTTDLQRVEVLRGPQGTLYGQGSVGGTLRFITNSPDLEDLSGNISLSAYNTRDGDWSEEVSGFLNIPVVEDVLAFRVAAVYKDRAGWIDQPGVGSEDVNDNELSNIRVKGLWQISNDLDANFMAISHKNNAGNDNVVNVEPASDREYRRAIDPTVPNKITDDYDLYNLTINYDFGFAKLTSASSYRDSETTRMEDSQFGNLTGLAAPFEQLIENINLSTKVFSQEVRLRSKDDDSTIDWTVGVFYNDSEVLENEADGSTLFSVASGGVLFFAFPLTTTHKFSESIAYFADLSYDFTERLTVGVGARYFEDDREIMDSGINLTETFDNVSSRAYLSFAISDSTNLYASISEGFRSGGFNLAVAAVPSFDPETLVSYEMGIKSSLINNRLYGELSLFYSDYKNFQALFADPLLGVSYTSNPGEAEIQGVEWNLQWMATEKLSLVFNGNLTDAEFTKINSTPSAQIKGDPLDFVPEYSYSLSADYDFMWRDNVLGFMRFAYGRQGKNSTVNRTIGLIDEVVHTESVGFLNAYLGGQWSTFKLELFGKNLLDEDGITAASIIIGGVQERPRTVGINIHFDF